jgi:hypothetical protein
MRESQAELGGEVVNRREQDQQSDATDCLAHLA